MWHGAGHPSLPTSATKVSYAHSWTHQDLLMLGGSKETGFFATGLYCW